MVLSESFLFVIIIFLLFHQLWQVKVKKEAKAEVEFLATLSRHTRTVNVVRFSPDGKCYKFTNEMDETSATVRN